MKVEKSMVMLASETCHLYDCLEDAKTSLTLAEPFFFMIRLVSRVMRHLQGERYPIGGRRTKGRRFSCFFLTSRAYTHTISQINNTCLFFQVSGVRAKDGSTHFKIRSRILLVEQPFGEARQSVLEVITSELNMSVNQHTPSSKFRRLQSHRCHLYQMAQTAVYFASPP